MWLGSPIFSAPESSAIGTRYCTLEGVRSLISSRSYSARDPSTPIIMRPAAVDESIPSLVDASVTPRSVSAFTVSRMCRVLPQPVELPHHDGVAFADVVHQRAQPGAVVAGTRHGVGEALCHTRCAMPRSAGPVSARQCSHGCIPRERGSLPSSAGVRHYDHPPRCSRHCHRCRFRAGRQPATTASDHRSAPPPQPVQVFGRIGSQSSYEYSDVSLIRVVRRSHLATRRMDLPGREHCPTRRSRTCHELWCG